jgi:benzoylformate decarboxylase
VTRTAADLLLDCLLAEGVDAVFGNPGTTELPLVEALAARGEPAYHLGLQEIVCLGMADGYAQASGRPAVVSLHASPGLGNAMGNLFNAWRARTPLVVTAGQQDTRFNLTEPLLHSDLVRQVAQYTKWAWELRRPDEVPAAVRRAFKEAATPPTAPVFLSLPMDLLGEPTDAAPERPTRLSPPGLPHPHGLELAATLLSGAARPAIVAGDRVDRDGARGQLAALAEALGAPVWAEPLAGRLPFPPDHPLYAGMLAPFGPFVRAQLGDADVVLVAGAEAFLLYPPFPPGSPFPDGARVIHLDDSPHEPGKSHPLDVGLVADLSLGLEALRDATDAPNGQERRQAVAARLARSRVAPADLPADGEPAEAAVMLGQLAPALAGRVLVDEAVSSSPALQQALQLGPPAERYGHRTGGLGWGLPAALGVALARPGRRTVCVLGDGSALYAVQGLWTAASLGLPVTFAILDNGGYEIIRAAFRRQGGVAARSGKYLGMGIEEPPVDWSAIAGGFGLAYGEAPTPAEVAGAALDLERAGGPAVLRLPIRRGVTLP